MPKPRIITRSTYLQALGLLMLAQQHDAKCREFRDELCRLLGTDEMGHTSDGVYEGEPLDYILSRENLQVEDTPHAE